MKQKRKTFKILPDLNVIDKEGRVWYILEYNDTSVKLQAMEEDPLPNCIVVYKTGFFLKFKEYIIPVPKKKKRKPVYWFDKKGEGSYFNPKGRPNLPEPLPKDKSIDSGAGWFTKTIR